MKITNKNRVSAVALHTHTHTDNHLNESEVII